MKASTSWAKDEPPSARAFAVDERAKKNSMKHINVIENHKSLMTHSEVGKLNEMASHRWRAEHFQLLKNVHEWTALTFVVCRLVWWKLQSEAMKIFSDQDGASPVVLFFFALVQPLSMTNCSKLEIVWRHSKFCTFLAWADNLLTWCTIGIQLNVTCEKFAFRSMWRNWFQFNLTIIYTHCQWRLRFMTDIHKPLRKLNFLKENLINFIVRVAQFSIKICEHIKRRRRRINCLIEIRSLASSFVFQE